MCELGNPHAVKLHITYTKIIPTIPMNSVFNIALTMRAIVGSDNKHCPVSDMFVLYSEIEIILGIASKHMNNAIQPYLITGLLCKLYTRSMNIQSTTPSAIAKPGDYDHHSSQFGLNFAVPIIRIFGASEYGQKALIQVHQVYQYFYIKYEGKLDAADEFIKLLGNSINHAMDQLKNSINRESKRNPIGTMDSAIHSIKLVQGIDFYGFHSKYSLFLKISVPNPHNTNKIVELFHNGVILNQKFNVFEHHIPYLFQFLLDYNLYGMDFIEFEQQSIKRIKQVPRKYAETTKMDLFTPENTVTNSRKAISYCELEMDILNSWISNKNKMIERALQPLKNEISNELLISSLSHLWKDEEYRRQAHNLTPLQSMTSSYSRNEYVPWKNEYKYQEKIQQALQSGGSQDIVYSPHLNMEDRDENGMYKTVPTVFQLLHNTQAEPLQVDDEVSINHEKLSQLTCEILKGMCSSSEDEYIDEEYDQLMNELDSQVVQDEPNQDSLSQDQYFQNSYSELVENMVLLSDIEKALPSRDVTNNANTEFSSTPKKDGNHKHLVTPIKPQSKVVDESPLFVDIHNTHSNSSVTVENSKEILKNSSSVEDVIVPTSPVFIASNPSSTKSSPHTSGKSPKSVSDIILPVSPVILASRSRTSAMSLFRPQPLRVNSILLSSGLVDISPLPDIINQQETTNRKRKINSIHPRKKLIRSNSTENPRFKDKVPQYDGAYDLPKKKKKRKRGKEFASFLNYKLFPKDKGVDIDMSLSRNEKQLSGNRPQHPNENIHISEGLILEPNALLQSFDSKTMENQKPATEDNLWETGNRYFRYKPDPPTTSKLLETLTIYEIPFVKHQKAFYSKDKDVPEKPFKFAGKVFRIPFESPDNLPSFNTADAVRTIWQSQQTQKGKLYKGIGYYSNLYQSDNTFSEKFAWTLPRDPISIENAKLWLLEKQEKLNEPTVISQIEPPTLQNEFGYKFSSYKSMAGIKEREFLCILNVEIHVKTREKLFPDPTIDPVVAIFFTVYCEDHGRYIEGFSDEGYYDGIIMLKDQYSNQKLGLKIFKIGVDDELSMFKRLVSLVRHWDPDILTGYELQTGSWGYITRRSDVVYKFNFLEGLSRIIPEHSNSHYDKDNWGTKKNTSLHATGRIFLNIWRVMRKQLTLISYTYENIVFHVLHQRIPKFTLQKLNECEFARIYGIDFFSVVTRGSQYKVEAVMARITRPENYVMFSPNREQVASMRAPMVVPLNMEPLNEFYIDPLVVLDFTSLYPSQMIAYNYCYSTMLGRVDSLGKQEKIGAMDDFYIPISVVEEFRDHLNVAPNGAVFLKPSVREGLLGRLLREILDTRAMVKASMKLYKNLNGGIYRKLNAKQEGLKLVANVMYGYTAASFSGRMPCIEIADAIVSSARYTLERSIDMVNQSSRWSSSVVYGDTDSLFVHMPNIPKELAFDYGYEIVESVTRANPMPVKLKFEKVYFPSILLAKKRYVGFSYENKTDVDPVFDAKGIETVRRDGCPLVAKMVESCLKLLFRTKDLSLVKEYLVNQWQKILNGQVSIQDYIIAKEVKLGSYSKRGALPAGAQISSKNIEKDPNAEPQYKERVPFVVVHKGPKHRLIDAVVPPEELLNDQSLRIHGIYYITKQLMGPLSRIFNIVGADVERWYHEMPKAHKAIPYVPTELSTKKTIDHFYQSNHCILCGETTKDKICTQCMKNRSNTMLQLENKVYIAEQRFKNIQAICRNCTEHNSLLDPEIACVSLDCSIYYDRVESIIQAKNSAAITSLLDTINRKLPLDW
ncbi:DNA polymerase zeta [Boothiomyces sp. JEL0866]|nr:DNA polymerase zeta [Boothiomyces sp. JEL0866]